MAANDGVQLYRVNGACIVSVGTGASDALETLGYTVEGGQIRLQEHSRPIFTDAGGPLVPAEHQTMGWDAMIDLRLVVFAESILRKIRRRATGRTNDGDNGAAGELIGTRGRYMKVALSSDGSEDPWYFPTCTISQPQQFNLGSTNIEYRMTIYAFPFISGGLVGTTAITPVPVSRQGIPTWSRTIPV